MKTCSKKWFNFHFFISVVCPPPFFAFFLRMDLLDLTAAIAALLLIRLTMSLGVMFDSLSVTIAVASVMSVVVFILSRVSIFNNLVIGIVEAHL